MKTCTFLAPVVFLTACTALSDAQDKNNDIFQQYMEKFGPPGPEHKLLEPLVGHWHAAVKMWMDPSEKPQESEGTLVRKSIMGGRFLEEDYSGKFAGHPFEGRGTIGYDRAKQKFVTTWIDSVSTALHLSHGTFDSSSKTFTFKQEEQCPITNKPVKTRDTLRIIGPDEQQQTMYRQMGDEKEMKMMEIHLTRKK